MADKVLEAILRLSFDKKAVAEGKKGIELVKAELDRLGKEADDARAAIAAALNAKRDAAELVAKLKSIETAIDDVKRAAKEGLSKQLFEQTKAELERTAELADKLGSSFGQLGLAGGVAFGALLLSANKYTSTVGMASQTGRDWAAATDQMSQSQLKLGQATATALLPLMEKSANLMETAANFAQEHPGAVKAALGLAGGAAAVGAIGSLAAQGIKLYTDVKFLAAAAMQSKAADKMLVAAGIQAKSAGGMGAGLLAKGAAAVGGAGAVGAAGIGAGLLVGGTALGGLGYEAIRALAPGGDKWASTGQIVSTMGGGLGMMAGYALGDEDPMARANKWFADVAYALGEIDEAAYNAAHGLDAASEALEGVSDQPLISQEALDTYIGYQQQVADADRQYSQQRQQIVEQYGQQRSDAEERYEASRAEAVENYGERKAQEEEDFQRRRARQLSDFLAASEDAWQDYQDSVADAQTAAQRAQTQANQRYAQQTRQLLADAARASREAETNYYQQRQAASQRYSIETQRAEEDHLRQMRRLQQDHQMSLEDAVRSNDAIGFLQEQRNYNVTRQRAEEDHQVEMARNSEDFAEQLRQMEEEYAEQQAQRDEERQRRLEEMAAQFEEDRAQRQADFEQRQAEQLAQFEEARAQRQADFEQRQADEDADRAIANERAEQQFQDQSARMDEQHVTEMKQLEEAKDEQLAALENQYQQEKQQRDTAFADQLRALDAALLGEKNTRSKYYAQMESDFTAWLTRMRGRIGSQQPGYPAGRTSGGYPAGRAAGGYATNGVYRLGEQGLREFVLSGPSTVSAERTLGGPLSQDGILAALAGGQSGGGNRSLNYAPQYNFSECDDARLIMSQIEQQLDRKLLQLERGY